MSAQPKCFMCGREGSGATFKREPAGFCGMSGEQLFCRDRTACEQRFEDLLFREWEQATALDRIAEAMATGWALP